MNGTSYYTRRTRPAPPEDQLEISNDFWIAWRHLIKELGGRDYFCQHMGDTCSDGHPYGYSDKAVQIKLYREMGKVEWPTDDFVIPSDQGVIFDLIEFFARFASVPNDSWHHSWCGNAHPRGGYDAESGRTQYEAETNKLFVNFRHPYRIKDGQVYRENSPILDTPLASVELQTEDYHLRSLIDSAIRDFQDRSGKRKRVGLRSMVDAFERLKTIRDTDKKRSVGKVIEGVSAEDAVKSTLSTDMKTLTEIGNGFCIRHHELSQKNLDDEDLTEFLFYLYFNYVRLILKKHGMLKETPPDVEVLEDCASGSGTNDGGEDPIPF